MSARYCDRPCCRPTDWAGEALAMMIGVLGAAAAIGVSAALWVAADAMLRGLR